VTKKRPRLRSRTTGMLYALAEHGPGGTDVHTLARQTRMRARSAVARLRWLQRVGLVRYVVDGALWQLTDDSMFKEAAQ